MGLSFILVYYLYLVYCFFIYTCFDLLIFRSILKDLIKFCYIPQANTLVSDNFYKDLLLLSENNLLRFFFTDDNLLNFFKKLIYFLEKEYILYKYNIPLLLIIYFVLIGSLAYYNIILTVFLLMWIHLLVELCNFGLLQILKRWH